MSCLKKKNSLSAHGSLPHVHKTHAPVPSLASVPPKKQRLQKLQLPPKRISLSGGNTRRRKATTDKRVEYRKSAPGANSEPLSFLLTPPPSAHPHPSIYKEADGGERKWKGRVCGRVLGWVGREGEKLNCFFQVLNRSADCFVLSCYG